ncbi:hypothetical protein FRB95_000403 [Tulasnella sp. JGI-2019a]|nr:hypothetical protein FRB95_000403 [Tulasnella sp. JGI-2019a]
MCVEGLAAELRALQPSTNYDLDAFNSELEGLMMIRSLAYMGHENVFQNITLMGSTSPNYIMDTFRQLDSFKQGQAINDPTGIQALFAKAASPVPSAASSASKRATRLQTVI